MEKFYSLVDQVHKGDSRCTVHRIGSRSSVRGSATQILKERRGRHVLISATRYEMDGQD
jgi:hypothetical protein